MRIHIILLALLTYTSLAYAVEVDTILYKGRITASNNINVFAQYDNALKEGKIVTLLEISSVGGNVNDGIELAQWIYEHGLSVRVREKCYSSCANYVLPAGKVKYLAADAQLLWHGGAAQRIEDAELNAMVDSYWASLPKEQKKSRTKKQIKSSILSSRQALIEQEHQFYNMVGVDHRLPIIGEICALDKKDGAYKGWFISINDMKNMGINNIVVENDSRWAPNFGDSSNKFIKLDLNKCDF